ncbi:MAG: c-type cytochrome [Telluria sp.]
MHAAGGDGAYVANSCIGCHGAKLAGRRQPPPGKGSAMGQYATPQAFKAMLRSGRRPNGSAVSTVMPFGSLREMNDTDLDALHAYLRTLPPRMGGQR